MRLPGSQVRFVIDCNGFFPANIALSLLIHFASVQWWKGGERVRRRGAGNGVSEKAAGKKEKNKNP